MAAFFDFLIFDTSQEHLLHYFNIDDTIESIVFEEKVKPAYIGENNSFRIYNVYIKNPEGSEYGLLLFSKRTPQTIVYNIGEKNDFMLSSGDNLLNLFRGCYEDNTVIGLTSDEKISDILWINYPENKKDMQHLEETFNKANYIEDFVEVHKSFF